MAESPSPQVQSSTRHSDDGMTAELADADAVTSRSDLQTVRLDAVALRPDDLVAWSELADRAAEPNPFMRPEFVLANVTERVGPVELMVVRDERRWLACLAVRSRPPSLRLPVPHLAALTDEYSFSGTPLIDRTALEPAVGAFLDMVDAERRVAAVTLGMFAPDGPVGTAVTTTARQRGMRPIVFSDYDRAAWRRGDESEAPGARIKNSHRRELARTARLLSTELGGDIEIVDRTTEPDAWEAFLEMESSGWKAEWGTALRSTAADAAFFRRMCAATSATGTFELVTLEVGGRAVAMQSNLIDRDVLFAFKIAYDPTCGKFSPGSQLMLRVLDRLHERGFALADSCAVPGNVHMNRLWPDRQHLQTLLLPTGAAIAHLVRPATSARAVVRRVRDGVVHLRDRANRRRAVQPSKTPGSPTPRRSS